MNSPRHPDALAEKRNDGDEKIDREHQMITSGSAQLGVVAMSS